MLILERMLSWPGMGRAITHLEVDHPNFMHQTLQWRRLLRTIPKLTTVDVTGPAAAHLCLALCEFTSSPTLDDRLLDLRSLNLNRAGPRVISVLLKMLKERVEQSLSPITLELRSCEINFVTITQLRLHAGVKSVEWDGQENGYLCYGDYNSEEDSDVEDGGSDPEGIDEEE